MLGMKVTVEFNRTNVSADRIVGMKTAGFELYLWANNYNIEEVRTASNRQAFYGSGGTDNYHDLPISMKGPVFEIDRKHPDHKHAMIEPGESKWFRWQGTVEVPCAYWDMLIGATEFVGTGSLVMKNRVLNQDIVFVLKPSGEGMNYVTNLLDKNNRDLEIPLLVEKPSPYRCTLSWCPREMITDENIALRLIEEKEYSL